MDRDFMTFGGGVPRKKRSDLSHRRLPPRWDRIVLETPKSFPISPVWLVKVMMKFDGYDPNLVIKEKILSTTDLNKNQSRLSLPAKQVLRMDFLTMEESETLEESGKDTKKKGVSVVFIDPDKNSHDLELRKWTKNFVLAKGWKNVINTKTLKVGKKYPLWCFRSLKNEELYFALVPTSKDTGSSSSTHTDHDEESACKRDIASPSSSKPTENWVQVLEHIDEAATSALFSPKERRFSLLLGSLLSSHRKDVVWNAIHHLHQNGLLTPEAMHNTIESTTLADLINSAEIGTSKAANLKLVAKQCLEKYDGDIPKSEEDLRLLHNTEMAQMVLDKAWADPVSFDFDDQGELPLHDIFKGYLPTDSELNNWPIPGIPPA